MNIDAIIHNADLTEIAKLAGAELKFRNGEWRSACPIHSGENRSSFVIFNDGGKQKWNCFSRCGGGDVIDFVMAWRQCDFKAATEYLGGDNDITPEEAAQITRQRSEAAKRNEIEKAEALRRARDEVNTSGRWMEYHANLDALNKRELWRARGIREDWQDFWMLGYCPSFDIGGHTTPTLSIPIMRGNDVLNIRHRLLDPLDPKDKYRPDRVGLGNSPFVAFYEHDLPDILLVEGEIKAAVTASMIGLDGLQVIGIPGKMAFSCAAELLHDKNVVILFDPDADAEAVKMARKIGGRVAFLRMKIDDAIIAQSLDKSGIRRLVRNARKI